MTDTEELKKRITNSGLTLTFVAEKLNTTVQALSKRLILNNDFKAWEMLVLVDLLKLSKKEAKDIFFANEVDKKSTGKE